MALTAEQVLDHVVRAEPLTVGAFRPFGDVISVEAGERFQRHTYKGPLAVYKSVAIDSDHPVELLVMEGQIREFRVKFLERHLEITQSLIPLAGHPFLVAVAAPDCELEHGLPVLDAIRAFMVPGHAGVHLHRGTWHEPPFPLVDGALSLIASHASLTAGLQAGLDEDGEIHVGDVDKRSLDRRLGRTVRITLP